LFELSLKNSLNNELKTKNVAVKLNTEHAISQNLIVLLVDDNEVNRIVADKKLQKLGFIVEIATNGLEAVEKFKAYQVDLILIDCQMPVMDGFEATRLIRELELGSHKRIPIIAMTANAMKGDREKCFDAGMDAHITKPVTQEDLIDTLSNFVTDIKLAAHNPVAKTLRK